MIQVHVDFRNNGWSVLMSLAGCKATVVEDLETVTQAQMNAKEFKLRLAALPDAQKLEVLAYVIKTVRGW